MQVYRFKDLGFQLPEGSGLIKADAAADLGRANDVVATAEERAAQIVEDAKQHFESERARGFREGQDAAKQEALDRLLTEHQTLEQRLSAMESSLARLVTASVRKIVSSFNDADLAEALVHSALGKVRRENRVQLRVPETLTEAFKSRVDRLIAAFPEIEFIDLVEDPTLVAPNIILETAVGRIDCDLSTKLDDLDRLVTQTAQNRSADRETPIEVADD